MSEHAPTTVDIRVNVDPALPPVRGLPRVPSHGALPHEKVSPGEGPRVGDGIQITLDSLGCLIPARQGRDDRYTERTATLPTVDEVSGKGGGGGKKFKTLLSNVRPLHDSRSLVSPSDTQSDLTPSKPHPVRSQVTGTIYSGDMCAVMGPSGAGKTTLLDIISRRKTEGKLSGKNYFDGAVPSKSMVKKYTAYIQQQDCFFGGATVSETILFAAMAKLPPGQVSMEEKRAKVAEVIAQLNLSRCANTYMGNRLIRGVSGGEMKRTAVACALLCSPRCMFLDEPTSGLDSAMAQEVIGNLRALQVKQGCTFVVTIHQPAPVVFDAFNRLVLLNLGRLAYWGDGRTAPLEFFAAQGFPYRPGYNVAEYLIDTLSTNDSGTGGAHDFEGYYAKSSLCEENTAVVRETVEACDSGLAVDSGIHADGKGKSKYANGFWRELWVLLRYKGLPRAKHPLFISLRVLLYILLAALLSSFFYSQDRQLTGIFNTIGILFIAVILPCFMAQVFVEEMKFDREVYTREFNDAYYRAGTYVAARILTEIPYLFLSGGAFASVLYWCIGLNDDLERFGFFVLATFVNFAIAMLVGFTIASGIAGEVGPAVVLPIYTTLNMLVGGFFIRKATIHSMWIWLYWISFLQWTWSAIMLNEFEGEEYTDHCADGGGGLKSFLATMPLSPRQTRAVELYEFSRRPGDCEAVLGDSVLGSFELGGRDKWKCLGYAACSIPVLIALFYCGVRYVRHEKR